MAHETPNERAIVAAGYDALVAPFAEWSSAVADEARGEFLADFVHRLPAEARVLDVGCGSGSTWAGGLASGIELTGIDVSPGQIESARRSVPTGTFMVADVTTVEFDDASFDGATALYSIGHLPPNEHADVFGRLGRWLRPGAPLLASLPAEADPGSITPWLNGVPMFFASLGAARYEQILDEQGWRVIDARIRVAAEPDGPVAFFWVLAEAPASDRS